MTGMEAGMQDANGCTYSRWSILIVDDDPTVLQVLDRALKHYGFTVWRASNGKQAKDLYEKHASEIDLVLLDVRMPQMDGPATLDALQTVDPNVRCCFMSGDTGLYAELNLFERGALEVFRKPFCLKTLADRLRRMAEASAAALAHR